MIISLNGKTPKIHQDAFIAPNATIIGDVEVEAGANIWFGAQVRGDDGSIFIGARASIQDNVVIHVAPGGQTIIESDVLVGHGAVLHSCTLKKGCFIGINSVILDNAVVGEKAMVAALSLVLNNCEIPARHLAVGAPAQIKKEVSGESLRVVELGPVLYAENSQIYREQGIGLPGQAEQI
ncbi:MAG: gamma carbonic anhydrase family protein [Desulfosporosinus sp.]